MGTSSEEEYIKECNAKLNHLMELVKEHGEDSYEVRQYLTDNDDSEGPGLFAESADFFIEIAKSCSEAGHNVSGVTMMPMSEFREATKSKDGASLDFTMAVIAAVIALVVIHLGVITLAVHDPKELTMSHVQDLRVILATCVGLSGGYLIGLLFRFLYIREGK